MPGTKLPYGILKFSKIQLNIHYFSLDAVELDKRVQSSYGCERLQKTFHGNEPTRMMGSGPQDDELIWYSCLGKRQTRPTH